MAPCARQPTGEAGLDRGSYSSNSCPACMCLCPHGRRLSWGKAEQLSLIVPVGSKPPVGPVGPIKGGVAPTCSLGSGWQSLECQTCHRPQGVAAGACALLPGRAASAQNPAHLLQVGASLTPDVDRYSLTENLGKRTDGLQASRASEHHDLHGWSHARHPGRQPCPGRVAPPLLSRQQGPRPAGARAPSPQSPAHGRGRWGRPGRRTCRSSGPRSPAAPTAPPAWRRCPAGSSPAAAAASLSAGEKQRPEQGTAPRPRFSGNYMAATHGRRCAEAHPAASGWLARQLRRLAADDGSHRGKHRVTQAPRGFEEPQLSLKSRLPAIPFAAQCGRDSALTSASRGTPCRVSWRHVVLSHLVWGLRGCQPPSGPPRAVPGVCVHVALG